ncbi:VWA domain-containing protein [Tessaracoccus sp. OS52]|uniref:vWA domain-containing protein n=1 Tax=Tessaracoccus sp. OS52 TaxID=2886691 RepID=UPI001D1172EB|nr:vWA domain-containing protein [Tessaracoccus sp. OS52]MCC2594129.1 VWA domain-containing protein [Tessaracoccus sp. OS52]
MGDFRGWVLGAVVGLLVAAPGQAVADDSVTDVADQIGVAAAPVDYVLVVDTSGSMTTDNRWGEAVQAIGQLPATLKPSDHVTLVTFDTSPQIVWEGPAPADGQVLVAALPAEPAGDYTDIGRAMQTVLEILERDAALPIAAVVLFTDGLVTTAPDSAYEVGSEAWLTLRARAEALTTTVGAFALSLGPETDAAVMRTVFPEAEVADQAVVSDYLAGLAGRTRELQVAQALQSDLAQQVAVSWSGVGATANLIISSPFAHLPVEVTALAITTEGGAKAEWDAPANVLLEPGGTQTFKVEVTRGSTAGSLRLTGDVTSRWSSALSSLGLGLPALADNSLSVAAEPAPRPSPTPPPTPESTPPAVTPQAESSTSSRQIAWVVPGLVLLGLLLAGLLMRVVIGGRAPLNGTLVIREGDSSQEFLLTGRQFRIPPGASGLAGTVTSNGKAGEVRAQLKVNGTSQTAVLRDGDNVQMGQVKIGWIAQRTRVLRKIQG